MKSEEAPKMEGPKYIITAYVSEFGKLWPNTVLLEIKPSKPPLPKNYTEIFEHCLPHIPSPYFLYLINSGGVYSANKLLKWKRVQQDLIEQPKDNFLRIHLHPKRFFRHYSHNWKIVAQINDLVIINKPATLPSQPHASNFLHCIRPTPNYSSTHHNPTLHCLSRLDVPTSGLLCTTHSAQEATRFTQLAQSKALRKVYRALIHHPIPSSLLPSSTSDAPILTHYTTANAFHSLTNPRVLSSLPHPGWKKCEMRILSCSEVTNDVTVKRMALEKSLVESGDRLFFPLSREELEEVRRKKEECPWTQQVCSNPSKEEEVEKCLEVEEELYQRAMRLIGKNGGDEKRGKEEGEEERKSKRKKLSFYEVEVELLTGRTHQIRMQLGLGLGNAIVGDLPYEAMSGRLLEELGGDTEKVYVERMLRCKELEPMIIGLQAAHLKCEEYMLDTSLELPWWRGGDY